MAKRDNKRGLFITFEGGEGSGKSSQIQSLVDDFEQAGEKVITTREPGGSNGAEAIRHVLLSGAAESLGSEMEAILFFAARSDNIDTIIKPALESGAHVLCDRFFDSTRVYQGASGKADDKLLTSLEQVICKDVWPDLTIILDLDPKEGLKRADKRREKDTQPDRFEKETLALQKKRRQAYLDIAKKEPERCAVIDGSGKPDEVSAKIKEVIRERLGLLKPAQTGRLLKAIDRVRQGSGDKKQTTKRAKKPDSQGSAANG